MNAPGILVHGAPERKELDKIQAEIARVEAEAKATKDAALTHDETRGRLLSALQGAIHNATPELKFREIQAGYGSGGGFHSQGFGLADLAWILGPEAIADAIMKRLKEGGPQPGLPSGARAGRLSELSAQRIRLLREEEIEILSLEAAGHVILRRMEADPAIAFSVWQQQDEATTTA
jgi:hypothetical protein